MVTVAGDRRGSRARNSNNNVAAVASTRRAFSFSKNGNGNGNGRAAAELSARESNNDCISELTMLCVAGEESGVAPHYALQATSERESTRRRAECESESQSQSDNADERRRVLE